jgi:hypothetical protein
MGLGLSGGQPEADEPLDSMELRGIEKAKEGVQSVCVRPNCLNGAFSESERSSLLLTQ